MNGCYGNGINKHKVNPLYQTKAHSDQVCSKMLPGHNLCMLCIFVRFRISDRHDFHIFFSYDVLIKIKKYAN